MYPSNGVLPPRRFRLVGHRLTRDCPERILWLRTRYDQTAIRRRDPQAGDGSRHAWSVTSVILAEVTSIQIGTLPEFWRESRGCHRGARSAGREARDEGIEAGGQWLVAGRRTLHAGVRPASMLVGARGGGVGDAVA